MHPSNSKFSIKEQSCVKIQQCPFEWLHVVIKACFCTPHLGVELKSITFVFCLGTMGLGNFLDIFCKMQKILFIFCHESRCERKCCGFSWFLSRVHKHPRTNPTSTQTRVEFYPKVMRNKLFSRQAHRQFFSKISIEVYDCDMFTTFCRYQSCVDTALLYSLGLFRRPIQE